MSQPILVFAEFRNGKIKKTAFEALTAARRLASGGEVLACVFGQGCQAAAAELGRYGAQAVWAVDHPDLAHYNAEVYAATLRALIEQCKPWAVLGPASPLGKDCFPRLAAKLGVPLVTDAVELRAEGGRLVCLKPLYSGKVLGECAVAGDAVRLALLRPNVIPPEAAGGASAEVRTLAPALALSAAKARGVDWVQAAEGKPDLIEAEAIVSGGRAMKTAAGFALLQELADVLRGAVGASRAAVDDGLIGHDQQVGQTGKTVNPGLYIACGISGAIQHIAGMRTSKVIVAINKDKDAPIFQKADYGIVGDLFQVVPALTHALKKLLAEG